MVKFTGYIVYKIVHAQPLWGKKWSLWHMACFMSI